VRGLMRWNCFRNKCARALSLPRLEPPDEHQEMFCASSAPSSFISRKITRKSLSLQCAQSAKTLSDSDERNSVAGRGDSCSPPRGKFPIFCSQQHGKAGTPYIYTGNGSLGHLEYDNGALLFGTSRQYHAKTQGCLTESPF